MYICHEKRENYLHLTLANSVYSSDFGNPVP
uniref:Uncharacterized protein n=1 Tax=Arundo donax TaxID=35708 RepID=A0A0A9H223_ARUDO